MDDDLNRTEFAAAFDAAVERANVYLGFQSEEETLIDLEVIRDEALSLIDGTEKISTIAEYLAMRIICERLGKSKANIG